MSRCIIHVGMRKTGSSSIQNSLDGFTDKAFAYADINGQSNHGGALYSLFADNPGILASHKINGRSASGIDRYIQDMKRGLENSIERAYGRTVICSGEASSYLFTQSELCRLRDYFLRHFKQVDIVAYVRPAATYIGSNFQQRVKRSASKLVLQKDYFNYQENFSKFDEVFGRENVHLWKFDPKSFPGGCVVRDFCTRLGIDFPVKRIVRTNESLSRQAVALLYTYRKLGIAYGARSMTGPQNLRLVQQLKDIGSTRFRFSPEVIKPVLERHRADIKWMEARLGQSLHEELGEHQPGDVRDESDLLAPDSEVVSKLLALLGDAAPKGVEGQTPQEVALLVHALREKYEPADQNRGKTSGPEPGRTPVKHGDTNLKVTELIEQMQQAGPNLLNGIPENKAARLIQGVFKHMNHTLAATEEGVVNYPGLGRFRVRKVEKERGGEKIPRTQIVFRRAEPGGGKTADDAETDAC